MSVGELAMTPRISLVAVFAAPTPRLGRGCVPVFLEQPHVFDGDDSLIGKGFKESNLRWGEGTHLDATCVQRSNEFPLLAKGDSQEGTPAAGTPNLDFVPVVDVRNVESAVLAHPLKPRFIYTGLHTANGHGTKIGPRNRLLSLVESQQHIVHPTTFAALSTMASSTGLHVCGRVTDHPEHLGRCSLVLQGFAQFCVAFLDLMEQPHVLDGDHRLIGEGFD